MIKTYFGSSVAVKVFVQIAQYFHRMFQFICNWVGGNILKTSLIFLRKIGMLINEVMILRIK